jgi:hypothetical protein
MSNRPSCHCLVLQLGCISAAATTCPFTDGSGAAVDFSPYSAPFFLLGSNVASVEECRQVGARFFSILFNGGISHVV